MSQLIHIFRIFQSNFVICLHQGCVKEINDDDDAVDFRNNSIPFGTMYVILFGTILFFLWKNAEQFCKAKTFEKLIKIHRR